MQVQRADEAAGTGEAVTADTIRIGMIGLDTSHVPAFVRLMNQPQNPTDGRQVRIVAAWPAGNPEFPLSRDRLAGFTQEVRAAGVRIVASLDDLLSLVDGVMLQSVDGGQHLAQATPVFQAGKPIFIDKPLAASLPDVLAIAELGRRHQVPWFTASAMRYTPGFPELRHDSQVGQILGCDTYGPSRVMPGHPDLYWYGVHAVDLLYSLLGPGCQSVTAVQTPSTEFVTGVWRDGRVGSFRGLREDAGPAGWGVSVFGTAGQRQVSYMYDYAPLVEQIRQFFRQRQAPVDEAEMLEVFAFMTAAEQSRDQGGRPVPLPVVSR